jgi:hypothetical protein
MPRTLRDVPQEGLWYMTVAVDIGVSFALAE